MIYAGLDSHKRFSVISTANTEGAELVKQRKAPNNDEVIELFQGLGEPVELAIEATLNWYWLYDLLEESGVKVKVFHPLRPK
jgi:transposase